MKKIALERNKISCCIHPQLLLQCHIHLVNKRIMDVKVRKHATDKRETMGLPRDDNRKSIRKNRIHYYFPAVNRFLCHCPKWVS